MTSPLMDTDRTCRQFSWLAGRLVSSRSPQIRIEVGRRMLMIIFACAMAGAALYATAFAHTAFVATRAPIDHVGQGLVVVLGSGLRDGKPTPVFQQRLVRGAGLVAGNRNGIISGGDTGTGSTEARVGQEWLAQSGWAQEWILEDRSRSTRENIRFSSPFVQGQPVVLVTSRTHLARSRDLARRAGWNVALVAAEDRLEWSWNTLRELAWETACRFGELVVRFHGKGA